MLNEGRKHLEICFVGPMLGQHPGWVPNPAENLAPRLEALGYRCILTSRYISRFRRFVDTLYTIYNHRKNTDILCLQTYSGPSFVLEDAASWLGKSLGMKIVFVIHGGNIPEFIKKYPAWTRRVLSRATHIVTPSDFIASAIRIYGFKAIVIPNGIDLYNYPHRRRRELQPTLLWMRTFHDIYNPQMAVDVLGRLKSSYPEATLTMAGQEKGLLKSIQRHVENLNLKNSIQFIGFLDTQRKRSIFAAHDIFLNTNRVDNMPVSVVEAAAFGLPIVATNVGGIPYLLCDGVNALLTPSEDVDAMSRAIERIISNHELAEQLSDNARILAESHDWSKVIPRWETLIEKVMRV